jgi:hypothetical protein
MACFVVPLVPNPELLIPRAAEKNVSAMVSGCPLLTYKEYETLEQGKAYIKEFLASLNVTPRQNE